MLTRPSRLCNLDVVPISILLMGLVAGLVGMMSGCAATDSEKAGFPALTGDYLGQPLPGDRAELFAPGIVNNGVATRDIAFTPDGNEIYFCQEVGQYAWTAILVTRRVDGVWSEPEVAPFSGNPEWMDLEPAISPDGRRFYFLSTRPLETGGEAGQQDIWIMDRTADGWSEPWNPGPPVNTDAPEFFPSPARDGSLYFTRRMADSRIHQIWRARPDGDGWAEPELLPAQVNCGSNRFNAMVHPAEAWIIVPAFGPEDNLGGVDYYLSFRNDDDTWREPLNLGPQVNTAAMQEWSAALSPDGRFLFVMSNRTSREATGSLGWSEIERSHLEPGWGGVAIWWLSAAVIDRLRDAGGPETPATESAAQPEQAVPTSSGVADRALDALDVADREFVDFLHALPGELPGGTPQLFAPDVICTGFHDRDVAFGAGGREIYFGLMQGGLATVRVIRFTGGRWSEPEVAGFATDREHNAFEPTLSADGLRVLFLSTLPIEGETDQPGWTNQNIFQSRRADLNAPWGAPEPVADPISTAAAEYFPSLTDDNILYFSRETDEGGVAIWRAEPAGEGWAAPVKLPAAVNITDQCYNATVSRDERWLLYCVAGHDRNIGPADYWIARRDEKGSWGAAVNLGDTVNTPDQRAGSACLTPDGRYLLFSARHADTERYFPGGRLTRSGLAAAHRGPENGAMDVYWVEADSIGTVRRSDR